jgi:multidrug efflux pump subunit AcrA (membrane-fusion protein)
VRAAQAALATARQPNTAADVAQQAAAVRGAQAELAAAQHPYTAADIAQQREAVAAAQAALAAARQPNSAADLAQQGDAVTSAEAALAAARQPYTAPDIAQQAAAVRSAQAALAAAQQPNTAQDLRQAQDAVTSARASLDAAEHPYTAQEVAYARAQFTQAMQTLQIDKAQLAADTELRAPAPGTILAVNIVVGQDSSSAGGSGGNSGGSSGGSGSNSGAGGSDNGAIAMATDSRRVVTANVAEADIGSVRIGDPADLTVSAYPGKSFSGRVTSLPFLASTGTGGITYPVQVTVDGLAQDLLPGMTANLTIVTAQARNATIVPNTAIMTTAAGQFVDTLDRHNLIAQVRVRTGIGDASYTQILTGLSPGQRILLPQPAGAQ